MDCQAIIHQALSGLAALYDQTGNEAVRDVTPKLKGAPVGYTPLVSDGPVAIRYLPKSLWSVPATLANPALMRLARNGPWREGEVEFPPSFRGKSAILEIMGPKGLAISNNVRCGLYMQAPNSLYPPHSHASEEFYLVLSGEARWQHQDGKFTTKKPGALIHHMPWIAHAMETQNEPLLAAWIWMGGNLSYDSYSLER